MRRRILESLSGLASFEYQMKFIVHGTKEEYVLPDELVDSACSEIETTLNSDELRVSLTPLEQKVFSELVIRLRELHKFVPTNDPSVSNMELITGNTNWQELRERSRIALIQMNWDLEKWERENVPKSA